MGIDVSGLLELALGQGVWAALYIYLFFHMLRDNAAREAKYQAIIDRLGDRIEEGIEEIADRLDVMNTKQASKEKLGA